MAEDALGMPVASSTLRILVSPIFATALHSTSLCRGRPKPIGGSWATSPTSNDGAVSWQTPGRARTVATRRSRRCSRQQCDWRRHHHGLQPQSLSLFENARIRTDQGGGIGILAPGGGVTLGLVNQTPNLAGQTDTARPGLLTLEGGNVNVFTDQSVVVAQSRIFTELGGNIEVWATNGDINAGKGKHRRPSCTTNTAT